MRFGPVTGTRDAQPQTLNPPLPESEDQITVRGSHLERRLWVLLKVGRPRFLCPLLGQHLPLWKCKGTQRSVGTPSCWHSAS